MYQADDETWFAARKLLTELGLDRESRELAFDYLDTLWYEPKPDKCVYVQHLSLQLDMPVFFARIPFTDVDFYVAIDEMENAFLIPKIGRNLDLPDL